MTSDFKPDFQQVPGSNPPVYIGSRLERGFYAQPEWYAPSAPRVIVCMEPGAVVDTPRGAVLLQMPLWDSDADAAMPRPQLLAGFLTAVFAMVHSMGPPLFVCQAGLNRSTMAAGDYLRLFQGWTGSKAVEAIREIRGPAALSNRTFYNYLITGINPWEKQ